MFPDCPDCGTVQCKMCNLDDDWAMEYSRMCRESDAELRDMESNWLTEKVLRQIAEARITAALAEHPNPWQGECGDPEHCFQPGDTCSGCFEDWPCATVRALTD